MDDDQQPVLNLSRNLDLQVKSVIRKIQQVRNNDIVASVPESKRKNSRPLVSPTGFNKETVGCKPSLMKKAKRSPKSGCNKETMIAIQKNALKALDCMKYCDALNVPAVSSASVVHREESINTWVCDCVGSQIPPLVISPEIDQTSMRISEAYSILGGNESYRACCTQEKSTPVSEKDEKNRPFDDFSKMQHVFYASSSNTRNDKEFHELLNASGSVVKINLSGMQHVSYASGGKAKKTRDKSPSVYNDHSWEKKPCLRQVNELDNRVEKVIGYVFPCAADNGLPSRLRNANDSIGDRMLCSSMQSGDSIPDFPSRCGITTDLPCNTRGPNTLDISSSMPKPGEIKFE